MTLSLGITLSTIVHVHHTRYIFPSQRIIQNETLKNTSTRLTKYSDDEYFDKTIQLD
jgi:hypothetical protein